MNYSLNYRYQLHYLFEYIFIAVLAVYIASMASYGLINILFSSVFLIIFFSKPVYDWRKLFKITENNIIIFYFLIILIVGSINSFYFYIFSDNLSSSDINSILLRNRKYWFDITFAMTLYYFLNSKSIDKVLNIISLGLFANIIAGITQLIFEPFERIQMLFSEPSAAGFFYCAVFIIAYKKLNKNKFQYIVSRTFLILGLLIGSKSQYVVLLILTFFYFFKYYRRTAILIMLIIFSLSFIFIQTINIPELDSVKIQQLLLLSTSLTEHGIKGLSSDYGIHDSFVTRLSSIYIAFKALIYYPIGLGFGFFNSFFTNYMHESGLSLFIHGYGEIEDILSGVKYNSPRSHLLELFTSVGVISMYIYYKIFNYFFKYKDRYSYLYYSFISLTLASAITELSPLFLYISIHMVLLVKEVSISKKHNPQKAYDEHYLFP